MSLEVELDAGLLPDGHVLLAVARERLSVPVAPALAHEATAGLEVRGDVLEARHLARLRGEVSDRVEHHVCDGEGPLDPRRRKVADRDVDVLAARLLAESGGHRLRQLDPVHGNAP